MVDNFKLKSQIEMVVAQFIVWMPVLPLGRMKITITKNTEGFGIIDVNKFKYIGTTDLCIKRKFDGYPESAVGRGSTIEEALEDTIKYFCEMLKEDNINRLTSKQVEYAEWSDF